MRVLVSVRDRGEALLAARAGAHFIDLKEPRAGALGALPLESVTAIVAALGAAGCTQPTSATLGDLATHAAIVSRIDALCALGVRYVKVGVERGEAPLVGALAARASRVVPVFIADRGVDLSLVEEAAAIPFAALMLDTADKRAGSLLECASERELRAFVALARRLGRLCGLAGRLSATQLPLLAELAPDFAGFRSAACAGDRGGALDPGRLDRLLSLVALSNHNGRSTRSDHEAAV